MPRTQEVPLGFSNLAGLDNGKIDLLLKHHMQRIAADCINRPSDRTAREVVLRFAVKPVREEDGSCESVSVEIEAKSKVPTHRSKPYEMRVTKGGFVFNQDFPDEVE